MNTKPLSLTVGIAVAFVLHTGTVVLSAPVTPIPPSAQGEAKGEQHEPCRGATTRTGSEIVGAFGQSEFVPGSDCVDEERPSTKGGVQPYAAMVPLAWNSDQALLGFPCSRTLGCNVAALEPHGRGEKEQWSVLTPGLTTSDTDRLGAAVTLTHGKSLLIAQGEEFTKLVLERDVFIQGGESVSGHAGAQNGSFMSWNRLLNFGPLLLLCLERLLGRL